MNTLQTALAKAAVAVINDFRASIGIPANIYEEDIGALMRYWFVNQNKVDLIKGLRLLSSSAEASIPQRITYSTNMNPALSDKLRFEVHRNCPPSSIGLKDAKDICDWLVENWQK